LAAIDDLIAQIEDEALRNRLREEVKRLTKEDSIDSEGERA